MASKANMPATNKTGSLGIGLGSSNGSSKIVKSTPSGATGTAKQHDMRKHNMPTHNAGTTSVPLGTTHHPVGQVPGYLKGK